MALTNAERMRRYREKKGAEAINAYKREWYRKNIEKERARARAYSKVDRKKQEITTNGIITNILKRVKNSATNRGFANNLTREYIEELIIKSEGKCALSGVVMSTKHNDPLKVSIDRINNKRGYVKGNVRLVTVVANRARNSGSDKDLLAMSLAIVKHNGYKVSKR